MSVDPALTAEKRVKLGSSESRRLRRAGFVPGVLYGHGEESVAFRVPSSEITPLIGTGHKVVDLNMDGASQKAMLLDVQWDVFTTEVLHFDLIRVSADERVTVEVPIEMHGVAPGTLHGGILDQHLRSVSIECLALQIPDKIEVNVNHLEIDQSITVGDLDIPEGCIVQHESEELVLQIIRPTVTEDEEEEGEAGPAEPEVIGEKKEDGDESSS